MSKASYIHFTAPESYQFIIPCIIESRLWRSDVFTLIDLYNSRHPKNTTGNGSALVSTQSPIAGVNHSPPHTPPQGPVAVPVPAWGRGGGAANPPSTGPWARSVVAPTGAPLPRGRERGNQSPQSGLGPGVGRGAGRGTGQSRGVWSGNGATK
ncbi:uncharacterized protein LY89DRAFT_666388 [Mollisia scopiformis]|uniref:Uncharacterized protein n=1 Tax=Mollisia scopiformis TaxID=149040 RepID=A0A194XKU5_MOLSC|nr:uncharacterized protein LY89DRAFT_666388 [Mollisia scopiformis]KUJ20751.1 hypothetical protein LY89DRAFT_666388 [Mollisia scopiformis]